MEAIVPYLNFNGNAAEALTFYSTKFGMLTDKIRFNWMFNHDIKKQD